LAASETNTGDANVKEVVRADAAAQNDIAPFAQVAEPDVAFGMH
jgi:hypothetical protein